MITYELDSERVITDKERRMLAEARRMPVVYDEDSPELTEEMERAFREARRRKPYVASGQGIHK